MPIAVEVDDDPDVIDGILYPAEDGKPLALTVVHVIEVLMFFALLRKHFYRIRKDAFISCDQNWYYEEGNPKAFCAPDIMVCLGVKWDDDRRRSYIQWRENNVVPSVCFETASKRTYRKNLTLTKDFYERMGVKEYFIYDPDRKFVKEGLRGWRLKKGKYAEIKPNSDGSMMCESLGFLLLPVDRWLRLVDPKTGVMLPTDQEDAERAVSRLDEQVRKVQEATRKAEEERRKADDERRKAEDERRKAEDERRRSEALQAEVDRLRAELTQKKPRTNGTHSK